MMKKTLFTLAFLVALSAPVGINNHIYAVEIQDDGADIVDETVDTPEEGAETADTAEAAEAAPPQTATATKNADNSLSKLELSSGSLSPAFQYNQTKYSATVDASVSSVNVTAVTSNKKATIVSITGNDHLVEGKNTIQVVVQAENEQLAYYTITVTKSAAQEQPQTVEEPASVETADEQTKPEEEAPAAEDTTAEDGAQEGQQEEDGGIVENTDVPPIALFGSGTGSYTIEGVEYTIATEIPSELVPDNFAQGSTISFGENAYPALQYVPLAGEDVPAFVVVELIAADTNEGKLFYYDTATGYVYGFTTFDTDEGEVYPLIPAASDVPKAYNSSIIHVGGAINMPAYVDSNAVNVKNMYYFYCLNSDNESVWYSYNSDTGVCKLVSAETEAEQDKMGSLKDDYKELQLKYEQLEAKNRMMVYIFIFVIVVLVLIILSIAWTKRRYNQQTKYLDDETKDDEAAYKALYVDQDSKDRETKYKEAKDKEYEEDASEEDFSDDGDDLMLVAIAKKLSGKNKKHAERKMAHDLYDESYDNQEFEEEELEEENLDEEENVTDTVVDEVSYAQNVAMEEANETAPVSRKVTKKKKPFLAMLGLDDDLPLDYDEDDEVDEDDEIEAQEKPLKQEVLKEEPVQEELEARVYTRTVTKVKPEKNKKKNKNKKDSSEQDDLEFIDLN